MKHRTAGFAMALTAGLWCVALATCAHAAASAEAGAATPGAAPPAAQAASRSATSATATLGVVGIGVKDLNVSIAFYSAVLGMKELRRFELGYINEVVMGFPPGGAGANVVLMNWPKDTTRHYDGNDVKLVFYVTDPAAVIARIRAHGGKIDREAAPIEVLGGTVVGVGRDPDNYVVELVGR